MCVSSIRELLSSDAMKEYNRARVYLDENYKSQEHFTVSATNRWSIGHAETLFMLFEGRAGNIKEHLVQPLSIISITKSYQVMSSSSFGVVGLG